MAPEVYGLAYERLHTVSVLHDGAPASSKEVLIRISKGLSSPIAVKLREVDNYRFNYGCDIDHAVFGRMKLEQCLDIGYEELQAQIVDLLRSTLSNQMSLRLEANGDRCKMVFYEKARLKSLIFLTIDLRVTDQSEVIDEMSGNITRLKETNDALASREAALKAQLRNKEALLQAAVATSEMFERQVKKDLQMLERTFCTTLGAFERTVGDRLLRLARRHSKLTGDVATLKAENELKCESSARLAASLHALRLENERNVRTVDELRAELGRSTALRCDAEASDGRTRQALARKEREVDELKAKVDELKKDMQDATMIIAQKTKTHDELAKDLVQANSMLVNFNNQYDALSKELDDARETNAQKDRQLREQSARLAKTVDEFERYRCQFNNEEAARLRQELHVAKQALLELEKQNREAIKLNGLLTRKISMGDTAANVRSSPNLVPPSQRNNY